MNATKRRLLKELDKMGKQCQQGLMACPEEDNLMRWHAVIYGPQQTIWEGGVFKLQIEFTQEYPNKAPIFTFKTKMFHPNIYLNGTICLDILQNSWSSAYDISAVLTSLRSLLSDPNPDSPANNEAARVFTDNKKLYKEKVREVVEMSWIS